METILDSGAAGLRYFELYLPRALAASQRDGLGEVLPSFDDLRSRYYEQRGIDLGAIDADIAVLTRVATELDGVFDDQTAAVRGLDGAWGGSGADRVGEYLAEHLTRADSVRRSVHDVRGALAEAARVLREVVARKADRVAALDRSTAGGLTPDEIDRTLAGNEYDERVRSRFLPHVRDTIAEFGELCDATESAVADVYRRLADAFARIDDRAFPDPPSDGVRRAAVAGTTGLLALEDVGAVATARVVGTVVGTAVGVALGIAVAVARELDDAETDTTTGNGPATGEPQDERDRPVATAEPSAPTPPVESPEPAPPEESVPSEESVPPLAENLATVAADDPDGVAEWTAEPEWTAGFVPGLDAEQSSQPVAGVPAAESVPLPPALPGFGPRSTPRPADGPMLAEAGVPVPDEGEPGALVEAGPL